MEDIMGWRFSGDLLTDLTTNYYSRESDKLKEAERQAQASPEERALMAEQVKAVELARTDRQATIPLILGQLGFKLGTDESGKKTLVRLTNEERRQLMTQTERSKADAAMTYQGRAKAAVTGTTKLPSFLKKDVDYQKVKENALLEELLGPEAMKSTAGQQAVEALRKKEETVRQQIQDQDLATAPEKAMGLTGQLESSRQQKIGGYEALPMQGGNLINSRGSLLQQMQQRRLDQYRQRLGEIEQKRQMINQYFTLGGTIGGAAASNIGVNKSAPAGSEYYGNYRGGYASGAGSMATGAGY